MNDDVLLDFIHERCNVKEKFDNSGITVKSGDGYTKFISIHCKVGVNVTPAHIDIVTILYHSLLDMHLAKEFGGEHLSFGKKYKEILPQTNNVVKIVREVFKILTLYRNSLIHSTNSLEPCLKGYAKSKSGKTYLAIESYENFFSYYFTVVELYLARGKFSEKYLEGILANCYEKICQHTTVKDRYWGELVCLSDSCFKFERNVRESFLLHEVCARNGAIHFDENCRIRPEYKIEDAIRRTDFCFEFEGTTYRVPEEALKGGKLPINELEDWKTPEHIDNNKIYFR